MKTTALRIGIYGASGSGKTSKANELLRDVRRLVRFDEFAADLRGYVVTDAPRFRATLAKCWAGDFRIAVVPRIDREAADLHSVSRTIRDAQLRTKGKLPLCLFIDEMSDAYPNQMLAAGLKGFTEISKKGRHWNVTVIGASQRVADVSTKWRGNTSAFYLFRPGDARDIQTMKAMLLPQHHGKLLALRDLEYLYVQSGQVMPGRVTFKR